MDFLTLATNRYSVRKYETKEVEKEKLQKILEAGRVAPSAHNCRPIKLIVVQEEEGLAEIKKAANAYRKAGYNQKYYEEHEPEILLHKAAKQTFDALHVEKLPSMKVLKTEYSGLLDAKKKLYQEYAQAKKEMRELLTAKANVDRLLKPSTEQTEKESER